MKNKIAIGLGLVFGLTAATSFADFVGASNGEVNEQSPFKLSLSGLSTDPGHYYTLTCPVNNLHNNKHLTLVVALDKGTFGSVLYDGKFARKTGPKEFTVDLADGEKNLVLQKVHAVTKFTPVAAEYKTVSDPDTYETVKDPDIIGPDTEVVEDHWYWFHADRRPVVHPQSHQEVRHHSHQELVRDAYTATENDQLTFFAVNNPFGKEKEGVSIGSGYLIKCDRTDDFLTPNPAPVQPAPAAPTDQPASAAPTDQPASAAPTDQPASAAPTDQPAANAPSGQ